MFVMAMLPETKGVALEDMDRLFADWLEGGGRWRRRWVRAAQPLRPEPSASCHHPVVGAESVRPTDVASQQDTC